jgi:hypothetical protein
MSTGDDYKYSAEILYNKRPLKPEDVIWVYGKIH